MRIGFAILSSGATPGTPTIGTATAGNTQATVAFTAPSYLGKGGTVTYRALSTPGGVVATSTTSPITVTGLTNGVSYTFQVRAETTYGVNSAYSSASNSVTPVAPTTTTAPPTTAPPTTAPPTTAPPTTAPPTTTTTAPPTAWTCTALAAANDACAEYQVGTCSAAFFVLDNSPC